MRVRISSAILTSHLFFRNSTLKSIIDLFHLSVDDLRGEVIVPPAKKLEDLIHLAELCVDLLQQNEEHYAEVSDSTYKMFRSCTIFNFKCNLQYYLFN